METILKNQALYLEKIKLKRDKEVDSFIKDVLSKFHNFEDFFRSTKKKVNFRSRMEYSHLDLCCAISSGLRQYNLEIVEWAENRYSPLNMIYNTNLYFEISIRNL